MRQCTDLVQRTGNADSQPCQACNSQHHQSSSKKKFELMLTRHAKAYSSSGSR